MDDLGALPNSSMIRTGARLGEGVRNFERGAAGGARYANVRRGTRGARSDARASGPILNGSITALNTVSFLTMPFFFAPMLERPMRFISGLPRWLGRDKAALKVQALPAFAQATTITRAENWHQTIADGVRSMEPIAEGMGAEKLLPGLKQSAQRWSQRGTAFNTWLGNFFRPVSEPIGRVTRDLGQRFNDSSAGQRVSGHLQGASQKLLNRAERSSSLRLDEAILSPTHHVPGWIKQTFGFKPKPRVMHPSIEPIKTALEGLKGLPAAEVQNRLRDISGMAQDIGRREGPAVAKHIADILRCAERAASSAGSHHTLQLVAEKGLSGLATGLRLGLAHSSMFAAILGIGVLSGGGALLLGAHKSNLEGALALRQLTDDAGGDKNNSIVKAATNAYHKQSHRRWFSSGINSVAQSTIMLPMHGAMGAAVFAGQAGGMGLDMFFVTGNPVLDAYSALRQAEEGKVVLEPAQKAYFISELVGYSVPGMGMQKGGDNHLRLPIANELMKPRPELGNRPMNLQELLAFIADPNKLIPLARDVAERQNKAIEELRQTQQKLATPANENALVHANENTVPASVQAPAALLAAGKPGPTNAASEIAHQGRVAASRQATLGQA